MIRPIPVIPYRYLVAAGFLFTMAIFVGVMLAVEYL